MKIDLKEYINGREDLFTATNVVEMEECLTKFLEWHNEAISVTRCCETFYCDDENTERNKCNKQCDWCKNKVKYGYKQ